MMSIKEFVQIIKNSKTVEYLGCEAKEVYNNEKTGVRLVLMDFDAGIGELERWVPIVNIDTPKNGRRDILVEEDLKDEFVKWCLKNEYFEEWDEKHQYYEGWNDDYYDFHNFDYTKMDFKDELLDKFYQENKDKYLFFHPLLPLDVHNEVLSSNQNEGWYYEKYLETELVLKIYEHLVNNKL